MKKLILAVIVLASHFATAGTLAFMQQGIDRSTSFTTVLHAFVSFNSNSGNLQGQLIVRDTSSRDCVIKQSILPGVDLIAFANSIQDSTIQVLCDIYEKPPVSQNESVQAFTVSIMTGSK